VNDVTERPPARAPRFADTQIEMAHGAGGKASRRLVEGLIAPYVRESDPCRRSPTPRRSRSADARRDDRRRLRRQAAALSRAVRSASSPSTERSTIWRSRPRRDALMATFILEAGLPTSTLRAEVEAMADPLRARRGVSIVGGDTKVVEHGKCDGMYVTTFGIGEVDER
jgi:hydrogenase expression/formation protein HypE